ncbi:hypothetical protein AUJ17_01015 [Candidatus Micrarchaeota archaeon CG1_02_47_40]|nr:MAG: hypothetical protein AUJ17_01015 [Candidatus Micrarchaeota archaeon CG1_02_47_40]
MVEVIPAILVKNEEEFESRARDVAGLVKRIQVDIMDGKFVPNKTLQANELPVIPAGLEPEYHLMVQNPEEAIKEIGKRNATYIFHYEAVEDAELLISIVKKMGAKVGIALSPDTPAEKIKDLLRSIDMVLVMTVYPGFSGQKYIKEMEQKIRKLKWWNKDVRIEVDGGINEQTALGAIRAGADSIAVASAIFSSPETRKAIEKLKAIS